jgi:hypothetical protein
MSPAFTDHTQLDAEERGIKEGALDGIDNYGID